MFQLINNNFQIIWISLDYLYLHFTEPSNFSRNGVCSDGGEVFTANFKDCPMKMIARMITPSLTIRPLIKGWCWSDTVKCQYISGGDKEETLATFRSSNTGKDGYSLCVQSACCGLLCFWQWQSSNALFFQQLLIKGLGLHSSTRHVYVWRRSAETSNERLIPVCIYTVVGQWFIHPQGSTVSNMLPNTTFPTGKIFMGYVLLRLQCRLGPVQRQYKVLFSTIFGSAHPGMTPGYAPPCHILYKR